MAKLTAVFFLSVKNRKHEIMVGVHEIPGMSYIQSLYQTDLSRIHGVIEMAECICEHHIVVIVTITCRKLRVSY